MARASYWLSLIVIGAGILGSTATAYAQRPDVRIAVYAPWAGPSSADQRHAFTLEIEAAVRKAGLGSAKVSSYAKLADLRRAHSRGAIDLLLCDAMAVASFGKRARVLASWSSGRPWVVAATSSGPLRGRRLALQAPDAQSSRRLVARLFRAQLPARYWSKIVGAPVTADARQLVTRGKADVVLIPRATLGGMSELVNLGSFTELSLVALNDKPGTKKLERFAASAKSAVLARWSGAWSEGSPSLPRPAAIAKLRRAPVPASKLSVLRWLSRIKAPAPELRLDALWIEPHAR